MNTTALPSEHEGPSASASNRRPFGTQLTVLAEERPDAAAITFGSATMSRGELEAGANRLARQYRDLGVRQGDMVTIALPNGPDFYLSCFATWKLGAVPQPVSGALPLRERQTIIELAESRLVVGVDAADHPEHRCVPPEFAIDLARSDAPLPPVVSPSWKAPTSGGSTGRPKIVVSTQPAVMRRGLVDVYGIQGSDCQLVAGPLHHSGPFIFSMLGILEGNHLVVLSKFDAAAALAAIDDWGVSLLMVVPTMMSRMLQVLDDAPGRFHLGSVRRLWHTAAPCPSWLKQRWIDVLGPEVVHELYGGTEGQALTSIDGVAWLERRGSVGRAVTGEVVILDGTGAEAPRGTVGEIYMRPRRGATYRYIGADVRRQGDWESIGDMGWMDDDGYLYVADRRTDLILRGGANVYPAEVEGALLEHPAVGSCAVVGLPDDDLGQRVHAVVHLVAPATVEVLTVHLADRLVGYKIPRTWEFVDGHVRDDAGKVRRPALAERAVREQEQPGVA